MANYQNFAILLFLLIVPAETRTIVTSESNTCISMSLTPVYRCHAHLYIDVKHTCISMSHTPVYRCQAKGSVETRNKIEMERTRKQLHTEWTCAVPDLDLGPWAPVISELYYLLFKNLLSFSFLPPSPSAGRGAWAAAFLKPLPYSGTRHAFTFLSSAIYPQWDPGPHPTQPNLHILYPPIETGPHG